MTPAAQDAAWWTDLQAWMADWAEKWKAFVEQEKRGGYAAQPGLGAGSIELPPKEFERMEADYWDSRANTR